MKSLNIFRAATAAGLSGLFALATVVGTAETAAATSVQQTAGHVTDPSTLQKFDHVVVVNATPTRVTATQPAATASTMQMGQRAYIDATTRQLRAASPEELTQQAAAASVARSALNRSAPLNRSLRSAVVTETADGDAGPSPVYRATGGVGAKLDESFMSYEVAKVGPDGKLVQDCVGVQPNDKAALNAKLGTTEEHGHDR